jgi:hypothetical protein
MIIYTKYLPKGISGMAIYPFILLRDRDASPTLITHERIHIRQQGEMLAVFLPTICMMAFWLSHWFWILLVVQPFYFAYVWEYLFRLLQYRSHRGAYMNISFEIEAFGYQFDPSYPELRPLFNWTKYL